MELAKLEQQVKKLEQGVEEASKRKACPAGCRAICRGCMKGPGPACRGPCRAIYRGHPCIYLNRDHLHCRAI